MSAPVEEGTPAPSRRANPFLAGLFSLFWAGIGHLYAGNRGKAAAFVLGLPLVSALSLALVVTVPVPRVNLLPLLLSLGLHLAAIVDAVREARRPRLDGGDAWYSRWYVCASLIVLGALVWVPVQVAALRTSVAQAFQIPTGGMEPTVQIGDHLYANKFAYGWRNPFTEAPMGRQREPERGDVIVFRYPEDRRRDFMKRVIGLPGETIEIRDRQVLVDGAPIDEPYARFLDDRSQSGNGRSWGPERVPAGELFVLGDNRDNSKDSRHWGFVPMADVRGQVGVVYFATGDGTRGGLARGLTIRWHRVGMILR